MKKIKLIASDFDGTLRKKINISDKDLNAIKAFRKNNLFVIATGRNYDVINNVLCKHNTEIDGLIGLNGAYIKYHDLELKTYFNSDEIDHIYKYINKYITSFSTFDEFFRYEKVLVKNSYYQIRKLISKYLIKEHVIKAYQSDKVMMIEVHCENHDNIIKVKNVINELYPNKYNIYYQRNWLNISPLECTKQSALKHLVEYIGLDNNNVYTIGDSFNDIEMLKMYNGIAIKGNNKIEQVAKYTVNNVYDAIKLVSKE